MCAEPIKQCYIHDDHLTVKYLALMDHLKLGVHLDYLWGLEKVGSGPVSKFQLE